MMTGNIPKKDVGRVVASFQAPPGYSAAMIYEYNNVQITEEYFRPCIGFVVREFEVSWGSGRKGNEPSVRAHVYPVTTDEDFSYMGEGDDFLLRSPDGVLTNSLERV